MINVIQNDDIYILKFNYDPELIAHVKNVPGRMWNPDSKVWTIPAARLGFLLAELKCTKYESQVLIQSKEQINVNQELEGVTEIPNEDISDATLYAQPGTSVYKHQIDTLKYAKYRYTHGLRSGFLLADQPGCGKTLSMTNTAIYFQEHFGMRHCLVIACVASAARNWKEDIEKHTSGVYSPYILGTRYKRNGEIKKDTGRKERLEDLEALAEGKEFPFFLVTNIETIGMRDKKIYPITLQLAELINSGEIGMVILDEVHRNCSMSSNQGKQLVDLKKRTKNADVQWIPMTGTPITKRPTDVFLPMTLIGGTSITSYWVWCQQYCIYGGFGGKEIIGYKNVSDLKQNLKPNMLRRLKKDVLDLPPKIHFTEYIQNSSYQQSLYDAVKSSMDVAGIKRALNPVAEFLRLRQVNGSPELVDSTLSVDDPGYLSKNAKLKRMLEIVDEIVANGEKVVIFSNWVEPLRTIYKFLRKSYKVCCYTGTMSQADRDKHKATFIQNSSYPIMIGTVGALGVSHTLTVARNVIFYDSPWNPADIEQCEDRCHRPGTSTSVNVYSLITEGTVDETVHSILSRKSGTAHFIVDDIMDLHSHPELVDLLMK